LAPAEWGRCIEPPTRKLKRRVAFKILSPSLAADADANPQTASATSPATNVVVVLNRTEELKARAPVK
jgi:hypothetical protein